MQGKVLIVCILFIPLFVSLYLYPTAVAQEENTSAISVVHMRLLTCFELASQAESEGANITSLSSRLNAASDLLSRAEEAYASGDFSSSADLADQSQVVLANFESSAISLKNSAMERNNNSFWLNTVVPIVGSMTVAIISFLVWRLVKKQYAVNTAKRSNFHKLKLSFVIISAIIVLFIASPLLQRAFTYPQTEFTELSLLGPQHLIQDYPYNIIRANDYQVYLNITNHLGACAFYQIQVKFINESQSSPNILSGTPSSLTSLYSVEAFVPDKTSWELPVKLSLNYSIVDNKVLFNELSLNSKSITLGGLSSERNSIDNSLYGNLIFELWIYNATIGNFQYNQRFVDLKLNMT